MGRSHRTNGRTRAASLWRFASSRLLLASLATALGIGACNSVAGLDELTFTAGSGGAAGGGGQQGGGGAGMICEPTPDECAQCTYDECPADYCDCMADDDCVHLYDCLSECSPTNTACQRSCIQDFPERISLATLLADCSSMRCTSCPTSVTLSGCDECLFRQCPDAMDACLAESLCVDFLQCHINCGGGSECYESCVQVYPAAAILYLAVMTCGEPACASSCS